jgi:hypothetical protein
MTQSPVVPRWAKRALAALLLTAALATPFIASSAQATVGQITQLTQSGHSALAVMPKPNCPGSPIGC